MAHPVYHSPAAWVQQHRRLAAVLFGLAVLGLVVLWILTS
jgi:hypothetical protein